MAEFQGQQTATASRRQRTFSDSSTDVSAGIDLQERLRKEKSQRKETDEVNQRLQDDYDELLKKYAQAENTIDQLRIGAKLNLYSDLPPPQQSSFVKVSVHNQPGVFRFPKSRQAVLSEGGFPPSEGSHSISQNGNQLQRTTGPATDSSPANLSSPDGRGARFRAALTSKVQYFQEDVDALQSHVMEGQWGEPELQELRDMCEQLKAQNGNLKQELLQIQRLESGRDPESFENESFTGDFQPEDSLDGQLYRCGLRLEEISDQLGYRTTTANGLHSQQERRNSYSDLLNRPRDNHHTAEVENQRPEGDLQNLMQRLRNIKEASRNNAMREGNSSDDVGDLDLNSVGREDDFSRRFSLGPLPDSEGEEKQGLGDQAEPLELQESGYFASESMSVIQDPLSEPLSSQYFVNSQGPHDRIRTRSLPHTSPHRLSIGSSTGQRSRSNSHRSRANTEDFDSPPPPEDDGDNYVPSSSLPSPQNSPGSSKSPRASSSPVRNSVSGIPPPPRRQDSHMSEGSSKRSRASSRASRLPGCNSIPTHDSSHDTQPVEPFDSRDRMASTHSSPREQHEPQESRRNSTREPPRTLNVLHDDNVRKPSRVTHGRPLRASVSGDSRVSTPLFLPNGNGPAQPRELNRRGKYRNPAADSERGFDSGFFGSEGSRISRGLESPDIPPPYYPETKLRSAPLQEQSATETEDDRILTTAPKHAPKLIPRNRDARRRRSSLQSLSESDEDRYLETTHSKPTTRTPSSQRERRSHRHTPTHPTHRSDNEGVRRLDDSLRRHASTPSIYEDGTGERSVPSAVSGRTSKTTTRHKKGTNTPRSTGPRLDQSRPMDKQSVRSYPGDRESVRSGRRSRRGDDSRSGYSDNERRYRRDPIDKLREELQSLRTQLQQDSNARGLQAQMYDDLRRRHDDLEREMARRGAEQQMANLYDNLQKKYDDLANEMSRSKENAATSTTTPHDDLRRRIEELARDVGDLKQRDRQRPSRSRSPSPAPTKEPEVTTMQFLCPFCGDSGTHSHGNYFYPGYSGPAQETPMITTRTPTSRPRRHTETQTPYTPGLTNTYVHHPTTPAATSTPYSPYYHNVVSSPMHHHTHTYPGAATSSSVVPAGVVPGVPVAPPGVLNETTTVHHIHHIPRGGKSRNRRDYVVSDSDDSESDEEYPASRRHVRLRSNPSPSNSGWGIHQGDELESYRLHQSLDVANKAARRMQNISKRMLSNIASDLIRSGKR
ncbi:serine/arginine repetitive matrix protein 2-like isoform X2 [Stylophora pistillata]|uniref:serine/arginine repetitive matrix protein 2-like isoform X2 n=1 Tax=Stylophora pistillata TaxID=50429 RepID=UPI000C03DF58|nr:serine/arginine repetitive matrix protein 2-like isoform X2 [Stylophora pistillata]